MSDLGGRIAAAIADSITEQAKEDGYSHRYTPMDDDGNDLAERIGLDCSIDPAVVADAVIEALGLRIERGERSKPDGIMWAKDNRYTVHRWVTEWKADDE